MQQFKLVGKGVETMFYGLISILPRNIFYTLLQKKLEERNRKMYKVHPVTAVQLEWSLWTRDAEEEVIPMCRKLGIGIVAYSPLGRGMLTGKGVKPHLGIAGFSLVKGL